MPPADVGTPAPAAPFVAPAALGVARVGAASFEEQAEVKIKSAVATKRRSIKEQSFEKTSGR
jgi:hypothetical protein